LETETNLNKIAVTVSEFRRFKRSRCKSRVIACTIS